MWCMQQDFWPSRLQELESNKLKETIQEIYKALICACQLWWYDEKWTIRRWCPSEASPRTFISQMVSVCITRALQQQPCSAFFLSNLTNLKQIHSNRSSTRFLNGLMRRWPQLGWWKLNTVVYLRPSVICSFPSNHSFYLHTLMLEPF